MLTAGMFIPSGVRVNPEPCFIDGVDDIQTHVGGMFDVVTTTMGMDNNECVLVGYVNDTGLVDKLPLNYLATALFSREIHGEVVVVWGLDAEGNYDGDNHDLPENIQEFMMTELVRFTAENYNEAVFIKQVCAIAVLKGHKTREEIVAMSDRLYNASILGDVDALADGEAELRDLLDWAGENVSEKDFAEFLLRQIIETDTEKEGE